MTKDYRTQMPNFEWNYIVGPYAYIRAMKVYRATGFILANNRSTNKNKRLKHSLTMLHLRQHEH